MAQLVDLLEIGAVVNHVFTLLICIVVNRDEWTSWPTYEAGVSHVLTLLISIVNRDE